MDSPSFSPPWFTKLPETFKNKTSEDNASTSMCEALGSTLVQVQPKNK